MTEEWRPVQPHEFVQPSDSQCYNCGKDKLMHVHVEGTRKKSYLVNARNTRLRYGNYKCTTSPGWYTVAGRTYSA